MRIAVLLIAVVVSGGAFAGGDGDIRRLGRDVVPVAQSIALTLDARLPDYRGSVDIALDVKSQVRSFRLHAEELDLDSLSLSGEGRGAKPIALTPKALPGGQVEVTAAVAIPKGRYTLHIDFHNNFDTSAKGLYRLKVLDDWYAFTQFEAIDAREAFPCWDEPQFKIPYRMTLTVPDADAAITNTPEGSAVVKDGLRTIAFKQTRPLPSYLLAVATGPLEFVPVPGTSIPTRVVATKGQSGLAGEAVRMTPRLLSAIERYFGGRYPYEKLDLIAVPEYWYGAMENPGAITYVDRALLLDPKSVDAEARERLAVITAHELAHMWFGDLVTMAWWDDLWLNESFASWMEDNLTAEVYPEFNAEVGAVESAQRAMRADSLLSTRAMRQPVGSVDSLLQAADTLAYSKGASVLHMTERWLGRDAFRAGVLAYVKAHADASATAGDLWGALGRASGKDVQGVLSSFLDQPGVPLVTVEPLPGGRLRVKQSRFLNAGAVPPKEQLWRIPVTLRYPDGATTATFSLLLTKAEQVVALPVKTAPTWVLPNANETGYYRWSIPAGSFARMAEESRNRLDARERVGFLGNASALLNAGKLAGGDYARILEAFASDPDPQIVGNVVDEIERLRDTFFSTEGGNSVLAPFVRRTLQPALAQFGAGKRPGESEAVTLLRPRLLSALGDYGRDEAVLSEMERLASAYMMDPSTVDPSLADVAIQLSAIRGDAARFEAYRAKFVSSQIPAERRRFLVALGNFRDPELVDSALDYVFAGPLRPQEVLTIPRALSDVPVLRGKTYAWMTSHYDALAERIPADFMVYMPYFAAGCSAGRIAEAQAFFADPKHAPPGTATELARVAEGVGDCVGLDAREGDSVRRYVTDGR